MANKLAARTQSVLSPSCWAVAAAITVGAVLLGGLPARAVTATPPDEFQIVADAQTKATTAITSGPNKILPLRNKPTTTDPAAIANQAMKEYGTFFGLRQPNQELQLLTITSDSLNMKHVRYNQTFNGVSVFGGQTIVHLTKESNVASINGRTVPDISVTTTPLISREAAITLSKNRWNQQRQPAAPAVTDASLVIFNKGLIENTTGQDNHLAWKVTLYKQRPQAKESYFFDARDGSWLYQITGIQTAISRRIYDCALDAVYCYLDQSYLGHIYGRSEGQAVRGANPLVGGTDVDDLYSYAGSIHTYYSSTFGLNGANDQGGIGDGTNSPVTKTDGFTYIDYVGGACPNAYFDGFSVNFCQGYEVLDVVGHEYNHAVGTFAIPPDGLTYSYESGALSEGYADIFGEAAQNYVEGSSDWQMGEDLPGGVMRSLSNPAGGGYPDRFYSSNVYCGSSDNGGIHTNTTILGHAAYLTAVGGTFNGCTITGVGRTKEEAIFYRALTAYSVASTDFNDTYAYLNAACADLYGATSTDCLNVKKALQAVELDQPGRCSAVPAAIPGCVIPTITSISSDKTNGYYKAGSVIDIDVTLSNKVTGSLSLTLNTGASCSISFSSSATGSCDYTIASGENASDLDVTSVTGTVTNQIGEAMSNFTPAVGLAGQKNIVVDTTLPTGTIIINGGNSYTNSGTVTLTLSASDTNGVSFSNFFNANGGWSGWETYAASRTWSIDTASEGVKTVYAQFADAAGNIMAASASDEIIYDSIVPSVTASPAAGKIVRNRTVTLTASEVATVYFTTDGSLPTTISQSYVTPITIAANTTLKFFAVDAAGNASAVQTAAYTLVKPATIITGAGPGNQYVVRPYNYVGMAPTTPRQITPFAKPYTGGTRVAACDVNGDGATEIVTAAGPGMKPLVKVYRSNGTLLRQFNAYPDRITGGVSIACGDLDANGRAEIVTGPPAGSEPQVKIFNGVTGRAAILPAGFYAYAKTTRTGVRVATGDLNDDGKAEIVVSPGAGGGPQVRTFRAAGTVIFSQGFFAYDKADRRGVTVAVGDVNGDGVNEIVTGNGRGAVGQVRTFNRTGTLLTRFNPYGTKFTDGLTVAAGDVNADGTMEIVTGTEVGTPLVRTFTSRGGQLGNFYAYSKNFSGGVNVATGTF